MSAEIFAHLSSTEALLPAIVQDAQSKEVLMLAWVNSEALKKTIETRRATFWSRSRNQLWTKGETSGNLQEIVNISFDCDADSLLFSVQSHGPACHTGERTCFYRQIDLS
ncbi:MAG: phosphoribosyl-AMP cyclohydrolase [Candidatus Nanopelagicaceae bacterium]|nr:phosphoribosyl-AMP cyclohydrolase [Candidatus Nanopelagicaceae bacterium]